MGGQGHTGTDFSPFFRQPHLGPKFEVKVKGQGQRSRSREVKVTPGPVFRHFSATRIGGQSSRSRSKVKGRGQRSRSRSKVKVTGGQGHAGTDFLPFFRRPHLGVRVRGQGQRSKVKVKGQGQMSRSRSKVKVKVKGFKFHGLMSKTRASVSQKTLTFPQMSRKTK